MSSDKFGQLGLSGSLFALPGLVFSVFSLFFLQRRFRLEPVGAQKNRFSLMTNICRKIGYLKLIVHLNGGARNLISKWRK